MQRDTTRTALVPARGQNATINWKKSQQLCDELAPFGISLEVGEMNRTGSTEEKLEMQTKL
jgi:hypothetical protein